jgi:hypothetical protein
MNILDESLNTVNFIFLGDKLPKYAISSLKLAQMTSGLNVKLIGSASIFKQAKKDGIPFVAVEDFYDPTLFLNVEKKISSDLNFREGFWSKSLERFFVLEQYFLREEVQAIFHAELDQLLIDTKSLVRSISGTNKKGIFVPFHSPKAAVASVMYVNSKTALRSLLESAENGESFNNEMALMARWAESNPDKIFALPTLATELKPFSTIVPLGVEILKATELNGVVDAAQIGQWLGGIDPRNIPIREKPRTKFVDDRADYLLSRAELERLKFEVSSLPLEVTVSNEQQSFRIFNAHVHSKCHSTIIEGRPNVKEFFEESNDLPPKTLRGMRKVQVSYFIKKVWKIIKQNPKRVRSEVLWRAKSFLKYRPDSYPFLSGDTFRKLSKYQWESRSKFIRLEKLKERDIIFCESELLTELIENVLSKISVNITLILGNSDYNHSESNLQLKNIPNVGAIFAQNIQSSGTGAQILPIGIENAWRSNHGKIQKRTCDQTSINNKIYRIMWGFNLGTNLQVRTEAANALEKGEFADRIFSVTPREHQKYLQRYAFVASPPGNGLDTHRTWEALYFKCVPILLKSYMAHEFVKLGLPVWVVNSYDEVTKFDDKFLEKKYNELSKGFGTDQIWADYWFELIKTIKYTRDSK